VDAGRAWRGGQRQALLLMEGLRERGHRVRGAFRAGAPLARAAADAGFDVLPIAPRAELDLAAARALRRRLRELRPDLVHAHDAHGTATALLAARGIAPVVASRRVALPPRRNPLSRLKLHSVARWLAVSAAAADALVRAGVDPRRVEVVRSGIPGTPDDGHRGAGGGGRRAGAGVPLRDVLGVPRDAFVILAAGRLEPPKGQRTFLEACALAGHLDVRFAAAPGAPGQGDDAPVPDAGAPGPAGARAEGGSGRGSPARVSDGNGAAAAWVLAGEGPDRAFLERLTDDLRLRDHVVFAGQVADLPSRIAETDVLVHASFSEGLGGVILDAMAAGVPVVATLAGGIPEAVRDGEEGLLVPAGDARSVAEAVRRLAADPGLRAALGERGRRRAREFAIAATVERTLAAYRRTIASASTRGASSIHGGSGRLDTDWSTR
jgi:glycosyltransferase involved in cell wall biosynthesis